MAQGEGRRTAVRGGRTRASAPWSAKLAAAICARVAGGELLYVVLREAGMPTPQTVGRWSREKPEFGEELMAARQAGGRPVRIGGNGQRLAGGGVWGYCAETADAVFERLCDGETLTSIADDPTMPSMSTIFYWRNRIPEFETAVQTGMRIRAERLCDRSWEMAQAATPETAYLTDVRLKHLRWMTGVMAPKTYRLKAAEPPVEQTPLTVLFRRFTIEIDKTTGEKRVVAWCPNPETGEAEREDALGWRRPGGPDCVSMPGGG